MTRRTSVQRTREDRHPRRYARNLQALARLLDQQLVATRLRRGHEDAIRLVRQVLRRSENPDEPIELVVIRLQLVVADRPIVAEPIDAATAEVVRPEPQRNPAPVIRPSAEHPGSEPIERRAGSLRVRLARDLPSTDAAVELAERP